ncbi:MAG: hypothetical protein NTW61_08870 [Candidatus Melainabacteria bacterium]|nr:hypothetical protein [Candidatus Melainabacteria bacterium]
MMMMMMTIGFNSNPYANYPIPAYASLPRKAPISTQPMPASYEQQNAQLRNNILATAQQLGFTDAKDLQTLNARLAYAQIEVSNANADPTKTLNLRQKAQTDAKTQNKILCLAVEEFQKSSSQNSLRLKIGTLIDNGEVPTEIAPNTFVTYDATAKPSENPLVGVFNVDKITTKVVTNANGKQTAQRTKEDLRVDAIDALSSRFEIMDAEQSMYTGLSSDATDSTNLKQALQTPQQQQLIQQLARSLSTIRQTKNYALLQQLVTPLEKTISNVYGLPAQGIEFQMESPDGGSTFALFDPASQKVKIIAPAIEGLFNVGEKNGLSGEALNQYVAAELVGTLAHESRHGYQYAIAKEYQQTLDASNPEQQAQAQQALASRGIDLTKDKASLEALVTNWQVYVAPNIAKLLDGSQADYEHQPLEAGVKEFEEQGKRAAKTAFQGVLIAGSN